VGLVVNIKTNFNYDANYWNVNDFMLVKNISQNQVTVYYSLAGYKDKASRDLNFLYLDKKTFTLMIENSEIFSTYKNLQISFTKGLDNNNQLWVNFDAISDLNSPFSADVAGLINGLINAIYADSKQKEEFSSAIDD
jgi:hypothetical protein